MLKKYVNDAIEAALQRMDYQIDEIEIKVPDQQEFGDLSTTVALKLSSDSKQSPMTIGEQILAHLDRDRFRKVEVREPGFINFFLKDEQIVKVLVNVLKEGKRFGQSEEGRGKLVQVEFVSSNPTGPLTVGHGRQAVLGDVLSNLYENMGYEVIREYYFNDEGRQVELLARSLWTRYLQELGEKVSLPEDGYRGDYLIDMASELVNQVGDRYLEAGWNEKTITFFKNKAMREMINSIKEDLKNFGVKFDVWFRESELHKEGKVENTLQELKNRGGVYKKGGALWLKAAEFGAGKDSVLVKSNGEKTYLLTDIAYHRDKIKRGFDMVIDVWGADHHGHVAPMEAAMRFLGIREGFFNCLIHQFVTLKEGSKMSTRAGEFITLRELVQDLSSDVVRYFMVMRKPNQHLEFDYDLAKEESMQNPVYYVQYAHTRIAGILRKLGRKDLAIDEEEFKDKLLTAQEELDLIKKLDQFPETLYDAGRNFAPHLVCEYLQDLASLFHNFYDKYRVITEDEELTRSRLALIKGVQIVLKKGLGILGISAPDRM